MSGPEFKLELFGMYRPATETDIGMDAFCELNVAKICSDAKFNKDFMYYAKAINRSRDTPSINFDAKYCYFNGFLMPENVALVHAGNFSAVDVKSNELCHSPKYMQYNWKQMTM